VPTTVSIIGTMARATTCRSASKGDGGRVAAIYVEAGDHVKRGQVLARIEQLGAEPQVANLEAALEEARAEAELADAEYHRAQQVGASGALSAEETEKRARVPSPRLPRSRSPPRNSTKRKARWRAPRCARPRTGHFDAHVEVGQTVSPGGEPLFRSPRKATRWSCAGRWPNRTCRCSRWAERWMCG
jgi:hypothetical protein